MMICCPLGTTILIGAFVAGIYDLVTVFGSVTAFLQLIC